LWPASVRMRLGISFSNQLMAVFGLYSLSV
jgi:hypothetical protein